MKEKSQYWVQIIGEIDYENNEEDDRVLLKNFNPPMKRFWEKREEYL